MLWVILGIEGLIAVLIVVQMIRKRSAMRDDGDPAESAPDSPSAALSLPEEERWE